VVPHARHLGFVWMVKESLRKESEKNDCYRKESEKKVSGKCDDFLVVWYE